MARSEPVTTILFVHGFLDDRTAWADVEERLAADDWRTLAVDLPGAGAQVAHAGPITLRGMADSVEADLARLTGPVVLVGQSMGALIGELVAAAQPDRVAALVLVTPVPMSGTHLQDAAAESFRTLGGNAEAQRAGRRQVSVALDDRALDILIASGTAMRPDAVAQAFDAWNTGDPAGAERTAYPGPVVIVRGAEDPFVTDHLLEQTVLPRFPQADLRVLGGVGHLPHLEDPDGLAAIVRAVADSLPDDGPGVGEASATRGAVRPTRSAT